MRAVTTFLCMGAGALFYGLGATTGRKEWFWALGLCALGGLFGMLQLILLQLEEIIRIGRAIHSSGSQKGPSRKVLVRKRSSLLARTGQEAKKTVRH